MTKPLYAAPVRMVAALAAQSLATGTASTDYPLSYLIDGNPAHPFKQNGTGVIRIVRDWGAGVSQRQDGLLIPMYNIIPGTVVKYEANATNVWTTPTMSITIVIPAYSVKGFPKSLAVDLRLATGYNSAGFRYGSLSVASMAVPLKLGALEVISQWQTDIPGFQMGSGDGFEQPSSVTQTVYSPGWEYSFGVRRRDKAVRFLTQTTAEYAALKLLYESTGRVSNPFVWVPDPDNDFADGWLATFARNPRFESTFFERGGTTQVRQHVLTVVEMGLGPAL